MRRNTAFQGTLNRPGPTPAAASHDSPRSFFRDTRFFDRPKPIERNDTTPKDVANTVHVRSSFRYEAQGRAVTTNQWGLFRDAGFFDRPKPIGRNDTTPKDVAIAIRVRRSRANDNCPQPAARMGEGSRPPQQPPYND